MRRTMLMTVATLLLAASASADIVAGTTPTQYTWIVTSCKDWNCALAAAVLSNGDPYVVTLPTTSKETPWIVLRRVATGSVYLDPDEPYSCETFGSVATATARFSAVDSSCSPTLVTMVDGAALVVFHKPVPSTRTRAVHH